MVTAKAAALEWRVNVITGGDGTTTTRSSRVLETNKNYGGGVYTRLRELLGQLLIRFWKFLEKAWNIGRTDPRKILHCLKVGLALTLVSLFYYMRPLYDGVGGNAMWAVMTVVVVFEYTVGATLQKCVNRAVGTFLAGSLGVGVHWIASKSGKDVEPIILQASVFLLATAATFSRFIPSVKARFDYGAMIFILTFSLVSVSGYRVDKLLELAHERLSTIAIGAAICIITTILFCPVWAGQELHSLVLNNIQKLADSLEASTAEYFSNDDQEEDDDIDGGVSSKNAYKCVLNSKATEEAMANFARWEPAHGNFNFRHPWKLYLKIGASTRCCAYHIEALNRNISSKSQIPEFLKKHLSKFCKNLSTDSSNVLSEVANMMRTMTKSSKIDAVVGEMHFAMEDLKNALKSLPNHSIFETVQPSCNTTVKTYRKWDVVVPVVVPVVEIVPLVTRASLLIEIAARVQDIMESVNELTTQAEFEPKRTYNTNKSNQHCGSNQDNVTIPITGKV